ncbi:MAG TPA: bifunctional diaminohydroxyphosphoribosylaminopyrimidine deaminase/5-amino-6-(5-phosphoribosylamino)uracil reductase RibD [Ignavibacteriales bacterium]|nr:bifunctional diaminohydroxyphosphoribosylaminopyrimidine deaminase/5-amino-6-(5-phosphoribosylamino)uracil reductase RibD [Ignavibacteriales bacterium]
MADESYIQLAIEIAKKGEGSVSPNPLVGCVIVKNNRIIGAGYHQKYGEDHAEINAINSSSESLEGSTLYVNLEPCSHYGKTPPCVERIIKEKIKRVVIGTLDINPLVSGNGVKALKKAGVEVKVGVLEKECIELNKFFFRYITTKLPYITLKAAQTLDGLIADFNNRSDWISSSESRKYVHWLRSRYDAVLIGFETAKKDNPKLTVRLTEGRSPYRVVLDSNLSLKSDLNLFNHNSDNKTIVIASEQSRSKIKKINQLKKSGVTLLFAKSDNDGRLKLKSVIKELSDLQIISVLVEGGSKIYSSFIKQNLFDDIYLFVSPKILGSGLKTFSEIGSKKLSDALKLSIRNSQKLGDDILIELVK